MKRGPRAWPATLNAEQANEGNLQISDGTVYGDGSAIYAGDKNL